MNHEPIGDNIVEFKWVSKEEFISEDYLVGDASLKELIAKVL